MSGDLIGRFDCRAVAGFLAGSFLVYAVVERTGLFRLTPASYREILHSLPALVLSGGLAITVVFMLAGLVRMPKTPGRVGRAMLLVGILVLMIALWVSMLTRFEGKVIRFEGQAFNSFKEDFVQDSLSLGRFASPPAVGILLQKVQLETATDGKRLRSAYADISYAGRTTPGVVAGQLSSRWPLISDWTLVTLSDVGYMVRFVISDLTGKELDADYVAMKLFPPGSEDYFTSYQFGYLFFIRCYPDYYDQGGHPATRSPYPKNPALQVRIVRNKDIVFNDLLKTTERVRFDNQVLTLPDVKIWVEYTFVRDYGLFLAPVGGVLILVGGGMVIIGSIRCRQRQ